MTIFYATFPNIDVCVKRSRVNQMVSETRCEPITAKRPQETKVRAGIFSNYREYWDMNLLLHLVFPSRDVEEFYSKPTVLVLV